MTVIISVFIYYRKDYLIYLVKDYILLVSDLILRDYFIKG